MRWDGAGGEPVGSGGGVLLFTAVLRVWASSGPYPYCRRTSGRKICLDDVVEDGFNREVWDLVELAEPDVLPPVCLASGAGNSAVITCKTTYIGM